MAIKFDIPGKKVAFSAANNAAGFSAAASAGASADHTRLSNRDAADQHPMSAITGLQAAIDGKADADDIPSLAGYATEAYVNSHHDSSKQDKISDLSTIRAGAAKGATAIQTVNGISPGSNGNVVLPIPSLAGYATQAYVNSHHDSTKQDTLTPGDNITIDDGVISAAGAAFFVSTAGVWGESGNTAKFDNIAAPASAPGDYIFYQGVLYIVTAHAANSSISVTKVGNAVEGATGAPYIIANNAGWGISGDNRSFDRVQLNPNTPAVGSIIYSAAAGMYFKINSVGSGTVSTTRIFKDLSPVTDAHINDLINAALSALDGNGVSY